MQAIRGAIIRWSIAENIIITNGQMDRLAEIIEEKFTLCINKQKFLYELDVEERKCELAYPLNKEYLSGILEGFRLARVIVKHSDNGDYNE